LVYYGRNKDIQVKVGIMSLLIALILLFGYGWLRDWYSKERKSEVRVKFSNAGNIDIGNSVTIFGVKRGRVDDISILQDGVVLTLLIDLDYPLPTDSDFLISDSNLMGSRQVDIIPGNADTYISDDFVAYGESLSSLSSLFPKIDSVIFDVQQLLSLFTEEGKISSSLIKTFEKTYNIANRIDTLFIDKEEDINKAIENFLETTKNINYLIAENKDTITSTLKIASSGFERFEELLVRLDEILTTIEPLGDVVSEEKGSLYRIMYQEDLYQKMINVTTELDSLLIDIRENPGRYFRFRLF